jgi:hypothetical protein
MVERRGCLALVLSGAVLATGCDDVEPARKPRIPADQQAFVELVTRYARAWAAAPNDIAREPLRLERKEELCRNPPINVSEWLATVRQVGKSLSNDGALEVALSDKISLNSYEIKRDGPLFAILATLRERQKVRFSGSFFRSVHQQKDCLVETRFTESGGMTEPRFRFDFTAITPEQ